MSTALKQGIRLLLATVLLLPWATLPARDSPAFIDAHIHFNWDQKEVIDAASVVARLRRAQVSYAVVSATPSKLALELKQAGGDMIVPLFSPYTHEMGRQDWYRDPEVVKVAENGLRSGLYRGIGEVHFMSGFRPRTDNPVFVQLVKLAQRFRVPMLIHIDSANAQMFLDLCRRYPDQTFVFAHAGGNLAPRHIRPIVETCDNAFIEFSARDPWRFGGLTDDSRQLLPGWRELVVAFPRRFMTGTDPVWKVTRTQTWDLADDGWDYFERLIEYHRDWLDELPADVRHRVAFENARQVYQLPSP